MSCAGARTDARDGKGRGVLHLAVGCSSRMVEKFLGLGAGIEAADRQGRTALHYSAAKGKTPPLPPIVWHIYANHIT